MKMRWNLPLVLLLAFSPSLCPAADATAETAKTPNANGKIKIFILAGDESVLEHGVIEGRGDGVTDGYFPNAVPTKDEQKKHVTAAVYDGAWSADVDYSKLNPVATGLVELGEQRTARADKGKRGKVPIPMTPFPEIAKQPAHTTVLRGFFTVPGKGHYELSPGDGEGAFNLTTVSGKEVYRRDKGAAAARSTLIELESGKRYAFETTFFKQPSHSFRVILTDTPGALTTIVAENPEYAFLKDASGQWLKRSDVVLFDSHPIHNNTKAAGHFLQVGDVSYGGETILNAIGPDLMLGHVLGNHFDDPVLLVRFATRHPIWFSTGSRSLGHDYLSPSSGGTPERQGGWDVIHFNFGVWDSVYRDPTSKNSSGHTTTSVEDYEKNLRTIVAKLKKTGATLIFANTTPVWAGEPGKLNADVKAFNEVAAKVMKENDVILDDLYSEVLRQGLPKSTNVHDIGNLAPKVTKTIFDALEARTEKTKPLPRILMIGDSITGSYLARVTANLDGKAFVCKNPGNGEDSWNGIEKIDAWIDLKQYLLNGQEYLELVSNVKDVLSNVKRYYPDYKGQEPDLQGMIWFQGIKDSQLDSMTAAYEKNLANLLRDLRKEFNAPTLPVVVMALPSSAQALGPRLPRIHDAQMALADPKKYPEFTGNVACIDTTGFFPSTEHATGGRPQYFYNSATAFLEIGKAMGQAMLKLTGLQEQDVKQPTP